MAKMDRSSAFICKPVGWIFFPINFPYVPGTVFSLLFIVLIRRNISSVKFRESLKSVV